MGPPGLGRGYGRGLPGRSFQLPRHDPALGSSGRSVLHTPQRRENWAVAREPPSSRRGRCIYSGWKCHVVRKEGAQDGDSRSALTGAGRGWLGVPGADRAAPAGAARALLPDARILFADAEDAIQEIAAALAWQGIRRGSPRSAPRCAPGCTRSPPTGASTRAAQRAWLLQPGSGTCLGSNRPCRNSRGTRPSGCSRFLDALHEGAVDVLLGPEARYEQTGGHLAGLRDRLAGGCRRASSPSSSCGD